MQDTHRDDDLILSTRLWNTRLDLDFSRGTKYGLRALSQITQTGRHENAPTCPRRYPMFLACVIIICTNIVLVRWSEQQGAFFIAFKNCSYIHGPFQLHQLVSICCPAADCLQADLVRGNERIEIIRARKRSDRIVVQINAIICICYPKHIPGKELKLDNDMFLKGELTGDW